MFLKNHAKSKVFQKHERQQVFFELFFFQIEQHFDIFEKPDDFSKHHAIIEIENDKFAIKYLKTHLHRVILKIVFPHPQPDIKFWNP